MGSLTQPMIQLKNFKLVLDYVYPKDNGEPNSTYDSTEKFQVDPIFDEFGDYINKLLTITPQISSTHNLLVNKHTILWGRNS